MKYTCPVCGSNVALVRTEESSKYISFNHDGTVENEEDGNYSSHDVNGVCTQDDSHEIGSELQRAIISRSEEFVD